MARSRTWAVAFQVKIRGFRIEVAEIETAMRDIDGIADAVVVGARRWSREPARATVPNLETSLTAAGIRERLVRSLPTTRFRLSSSRWPHCRRPRPETDRLRLPDVDRTRPEMEAPFTCPADRADARRDVDRDAGHRSRRHSRRLLRTGRRLVDGDASHRPNRRRWRLICRSSSC